MYPFKLQNAHAQMIISMLINSDLNAHEIASSITINHNIAHRNICNILLGTTLFIVGKLWSLDFFIFFYLDSNVIIYRTIY